MALDKQISFGKAKESFNRTIWFFAVAFFAFVSLFSIAPQIANGLSLSGKYNGNSSVSCFLPVWNRNYAHLGNLTMGANPPNVPVQSSMIYENIVSGSSYLYGDRDVVFEIGSNLDNAYYARASLTTRSAVGTVDNGDASLGDPDLGECAFRNYKGQLFGKVDTKIIGSSFEGEIKNNNYGEYQDDGAYYLDLNFSSQAKSFGPDPIAWSYALSLQEPGYDSNSNKVTGTGGAKLVRRNIYPKTAVKDVENGTISYYDVSTCNVSLLSYNDAEILSSEGIGSYSEKGSQKVTNALGIDSEVNWQNSSSPSYTGNPIVLRERRYYLENEDLINKARGFLGCKELEANGIQPSYYDCELSIDNGVIDSKTQESRLKELKDLIKSHNQPGASEIEVVTFVPKAAALPVIDFPPTYNEAATGDELLDSQLIKYASQVPLTLGIGCSFKVGPDLPPPPDLQDPLSCEVSVAPSTASVPAFVTWSARITSNEGAGYTYTYNWSGTDDLKGASPEVSTIYETSGVKEGEVTVTRTKGGLAGSSKTVTCKNEIELSSPFSVSCLGTPNPQRARDPVTWKAFATGGSGIYDYSWSGEGIGNRETRKEFEVNYASEGEKIARVTVRDAGNNSLVASASCSVKIEDFALSCEGLPNQQYSGLPVTWKANVISPQAGVSYSYKWSGDVEGQSQIVTQSYLNPTGGKVTKTANVEVSGNGGVKNASCSVDILKDETLPSPFNFELINCENAEVKAGETVTLNFGKRLLSTETPNQKVKVFLSKITGPKVSVLGNESATSLALATENASVDINGVIEEFLTANVKNNGIKFSAASNASVGSYDITVGGISEGSPVGSNRVSKSASCKVKVSLPSFAPVITLNDYKLCESGVIRFSWIDTGTNRYKIYKDGSMVGEMIPTSGGGAASYDASRSRWTYVLNGNPGNLAHFQISSVYSDGRGESAKSNILTTTYSLACECFATPSLISPDTETAVTWTAVANKPGNFSYLWSGHSEMINNALERVKANPVIKYKAPTAVRTALVSLADKDTGESAVWTPSCVLNINSSEAVKVPSLENLGANVREHGLGAIKIKVNPKMSGSYDLYRRNAGPTSTFWTSNPVKIDTRKASASYEIFNDGLQPGGLYDYGAKVYDSQSEVLSEVKATYSTPRIVLQSENLCVNYGGQAGLNFVANLVDSCEPSSNPSVLNWNNGSAFRSSIDPSNTDASNFKKVATDGFWRMSAVRQDYVFSNQCKRQEKLVEIYAPRNESGPIKVSSEVYVRPQPPQRLTATPGIKGSREIIVNWQRGALAENQELKVNDRLVATEKGSPGGITCENQGVGAKCSFIHRNLTSSASYNYSVSSLRTNSTIPSEEVPADCDNSSSQVKQTAPKEESILTISCSVEPSNMEPGGLAAARLDSVRGGVGPYSISWVLVPENISPEVYAKTDSSSWVTLVASSGRYNIWTKVVSKDNQTKTANCGTIAVSQESAEIILKCNKEDYAQSFSSPFDVSLSWRSPAQKSGSVKEDSCVITKTENGVSETLWRNTPNFFGGNSTDYKNTLDKVGQATYKISCEPASGFSGQPTDTCLAEVVLAECPPIVCKVWDKDGELRSKTGEEDEERAIVSDPQASVQLEWVWEGAGQCQILGNLPGLSGGGVSLPCEKQKAESGPLDKTGYYQAMIVANKEGCAQIFDTCYIRTETRPPQYYLVAEPGEINLITVGTAEDKQVRSESAKVTVELEETGGSFNEKVFLSVDEIQGLNPSQYIVEGGDWFRPGQSAKFVIKPKDPEFNPIPVGRYTIVIKGLSEKTKLEEKTNVVLVVRNVAPDYREE